MKCKIELDKSVVMAWVGSPARSQMNPVPAKISCHDPEKNMAQAVPRDMASFDGLNDWRTFIVLRAKCV